MPRDGKTGITVDEQTFEELKTRKPDDETWDEFLTRGAKAVEPVLGDDNHETPVREQTERHLDYSGRQNTGHEVYYWPQAEKFLFLPPQEQQHRKYRDMFESDGYEPTRINTKEELKWVLERNND